MDKYLAKIKDIKKLSEFPLGEVVYVSIVRSKIPNGKIISINIPHLPKDYVCITSKDIPGSKYLTEEGVKIPVLAIDTISYVGEPIAIIAGFDRKTVEEAVHLTTVITEESTPEFTFESYSSSQIINEKIFKSGDINKAFSETNIIVSGSFRFGPQDHYYPEPQGAAAVINYDKLVIFSSTQWPFHVRKSVASVLDADVEDVIVRSTTAGPNLDGKLWYPSLLACHAALASFFSKMPAILMLSRLDDFLYTTKRAPVIVSYRAALSNTGILKALDSRIALNLGAYSPFSEELVSMSVNALIGPYSCPNRKITARAIKTNLPPMGAFAGFGSSSVAFALERIADECARAVQINPSEWRALNIIKKDDASLGFVIKKNIPYDKINTWLLKESDFLRKHSSFELIRKRQNEPGIMPGYGIGMSLYLQHNGNSLNHFDTETEGIEVTLTKDSILIIKTTTIPSSDISIEAWKKLAASYMGIDSNSVIIESIGTDNIPNSGPGTLSRSIGIITKLIESACSSLCSKRFREALPITIKKVIRKKKSKEQWENPDDASFGGAVVELELDPVDWTPYIRGIWICIKAGRILSRKAARLAIERDASIALGLCLGEYIDLSNGPLKPSSLQHYKIARLKDKPEVHVEFISDENSAPLGIGEMAYALIPPAFANALSQARNKTISEMPIVRLETKGQDFNDN